MLLWLPGNGDGFMPEQGHWMAHSGFIAAIAAAGAMVAFAASAADAPAQTSLAAVKLLQPGSWALKERRSGPIMKTVCVTDPLMLLQVAHENTVCSRFVIASEKSSVTVHYTCPGRGHGRTTLRVENPRLAQISSQGIAGQDPFNFDLEARRVGSCGGAARGL